MYEEKSLKPFFKNAFILMLLLAFGLKPVFGQTGKIAGRVTDGETGDPLTGANVVVEGLLAGASTDMDGFYFILNVKPGTYAVTTSYIGYQTVTATNLRVNTGKTATVDLALNPTTIKGEAITVVAEREIIKKDLTATERSLSTEDLERSWVRSVPEALETQTGVFGGHIRGGTLVETVYLLDNVSLNSGLLSDNYTGINPTTVEEISVLTGGYNAEYGNANSGIINIVTKETSSGIRGSFIGRMRPAGKYHWGRNLYSRDNFDWANHDLNFWTEQSQDPGSAYFGQDPNELLTQWQKQITPDPAQSDYADRPEYETEFTLYGAFTNELGFLFSGRYKNAVNIFPQQEKYNPEFNLQGRISYKLTNAIKLNVSGLYGGYTSSGFGPTNFNTIENSQEMAWNGLPQITDPYQWEKYALGGAWTGWPEVRRVGNFSMKMTHIINPKTFYELDFSYLYDDMDRTDRDGIVPDDKWSFDDDEFGMLGIYLTRGYKHWEDRMNSKVYSLRGDISSQVTKHHNVKAGFVARSYNFSYDHQMSAYEGGERWNLMNVYDGKPYEGTVYAQDKIEFAGLIVNAGLRLDLFNQNREAPKNMFDPLAFQGTTPGNVVDGLPGDPEREKTKLQTAFAPRLGISHPISDNSVLHFVYGHFYQRPSWHKMLGFPFINFVEDLNAARNPYPDPSSEQYTYMDQWMGFQGNPDMGYERTIQYEIGVDQNIANSVRLDLTGYYKDANRQTVFREGNLYDPRWGDPNAWTTLFNATNQYNVPIMVSNTAFADIRGLELELNTRFNWPVNFNLSYDMSWSTGGVFGFSNLFELGSGINTPQGFGQTKKAWNSNYKFKGNALLHFGPQYGAILNDFLMNLYYEYFSGPQYTYHGPGDTSTEPNNMRWDGHNRWNLKVAKGFRALGTRPEIALEVRNLFNNKDLNMLGGDDLINYHEKGELPKHWWSGEDNEWSWYNVWANPPRQVNLQLKVDF